MHGRKIILMLLTIVVLAVELQNNASAWWYIGTLVAMMGIWNIMDQK